MPGTADHHTSAGPALPPPPPLPTRWVDPRGIVFVGTGLWFVAFVVLLVLDGPHGLSVWTCLAGGVLGLIGSAIMIWQRAAARRGSRGAQQV